ncbi:MAG: OPT family oligopeptide transporter [Planctomycetaceae bacterium]
MDSKPVDSSDRAGGERVDPDQAARDWLQNVYQGDDAKQLTVRAVVTGMLIGGVMSISNLYVGLKTGWGLGVTITACIIAYAVFQVLERLIPAYRDEKFTILENYTMSSAASAAGYMSSSGLVSALPALYLSAGVELSWRETMAWIAAISFLGVFMAIPLKRQLINIDQLPFPSGIATAETLKSMHTSGLEALDKARALLWSAVAGASLAFWKEGLPAFGAWLGGLFNRNSISELSRRAAFPEEFPLYPGGGSLLAKYTLGFEGSLIMVAAGAIMGIRVGVSLLIGACIYYGIIGPRLVELEIAQPGYKGLVSWTLWPATAMMVTSGLLSFAMKWRTVLRAFQGLGALLGRRSTTADPLSEVEVPGSWFLLGTLVSGGACVLLGHFLFQVTWWMGILAVLVTFLLSIVAARATGETDITPIGAMGKITQLLYGVIAPTNKVTNLMTASITAGAASHSADLLTDLKSGYLLGGNPRKQTLSQLFGVAAGTLFCVPVYMIIATPEKLGTKELPAPAAKVWAGVADMLANGIENLPVSARWGIVVGGLIGILLTLLEEYVPQEHRHWVPSATGLGIAGVIPAFNSISMFIGALGAWTLAKSRPQIDEKYTITVSSGLIAGETLMGVGIKIWDAAPDLWRALLARFSGSAG